MSAFTYETLSAYFAIFLAGCILSYSVGKYRSGSMHKVMFFSIVALGAAVIFFAVSKLGPS